VQVSATNYTPTKFLVKVLNVNSRGRAYEIDLECNTSETISTLKERLANRDSGVFADYRPLFHKERELLDNLLVKDYGVEPGDIFQRKERDIHSRVVQMDTHE
jgi:hypothetical protein